MVSLMPQTLRFLKPLNFLTVLNSLKRKKLKKPMELKKQLKCLRTNMSTPKTRSFNLLEKKNTKKKLMSWPKLKQMNPKKLVSKQWLVISIPEMTARETLSLVMGLKLLSAVLKETNFQEARSKESPLPEPSLENQRFFSLTKLPQH